MWMRRAVPLLLLLLALPAAAERAAPVARPSKPAAAASSALPAAASGATPPTASSTSSPAPARTAAPPSWSAALGSRVREIDLAHAGDLSVYVQDVASGEAYGYGADVPTYLSSTIKLVVALEVLRQVDVGTLSLEQRVPLRTQDVRDGVGPLGPDAVGTRPSVGALLELMLVRSDNMAADRLIGLVGEAQLNAEAARRGVHFCALRSLLAERQQLYGLLDQRGLQLTGAQLRELGRHDSLDARAQAFGALLGEAPGRWREPDLVRAFERFYATGVNAAPARELGALLAQAARCDRLSTESCGRLHALMRACRTGAARVRAGLPANVAWAHKTGTQFQRACDVGFFLVTPERPVVVVACARDFDRVHEAEAAFAAVGAAVWEALGAQAPAEARAR